MRWTSKVARFVSPALLLAACAARQTPPAPPPRAAAAPAAPALPHVVFDTDANNELDDQHAIAYLLFNSDRFLTEGITTNKTHGGGGIDQHTAEAVRVVRLCASEGAVKVYSGATGTFEAIRGTLDRRDHDGLEAVDFIVDRARHHTPENKLVLIAVGKLTNVALALQKDPGILPRVRVVWLGSNWPRGTDEYNEKDDHGAVNALMDSAVELDVALVRYGVKGPESATAEVKVSIDEIRKEMAGLGPRVAPVEGRHGGTFTTFGDYSVELFAKMGDKQRALFDMAAVAIVKNAGWAVVEEVPAPIIVDKKWQARPDNPRKVRFWKGFDRDAIIADFYAVMRSPKLPAPTAVSAAAAAAERAAR